MKSLTNLIYVFPVEPISSTLWNYLQHQYHYLTHPWLLMLPVWNYKLNNVDMPTRIWMISNKNPCRPPHRICNQMDMRYKILPPEAGPAPPQTLQRVWWRAIWTMKHPQYLKNGSAYGNKDQYCVQINAS